MSRSLERYGDALARVVTELACGDEIPARVRRHRVAAIERGALVELLDDLALHERALRARSTIIARGLVYTSALAGDRGFARPRAHRGNTITSPPARPDERRKANDAEEKLCDRGRARDGPEARASPHDHRTAPRLLVRGIAMPARPMPKPPSQLSLHARRRGAELSVAVEARGGPAIATVVLLGAAAVVVVLLRWLS